MQNFIHEICDDATFNVQYAVKAYPGGKRKMRKAFRKFAMAMINDMKKKKRGKKGRGRNAAPTTK